MVDADVVREARRRLGRVGVWLNKQVYGPVPAAEETREVARIEALGYGSVWTGETVGGKDAFAQHALYLAATEDLVVGTGIANVWARHGGTAHGGAATLADAYPGRFVFGIGAGHPYQAQAVGVAEWKPLQKMRSYLDEMDAGTPLPPGFPARRLVSDAPYPRVLAAINPRMLDLARDRADGVHTFFVPVAHTADARRVLGPDGLVIPQVSALIEPDPDVARATLRATASQGLRVAAYARNLARLGFSADEIENVSDRVLDAVYAHGDEKAIARRVAEYLDAGADHVLVTPSAGSLSGMVDELERLAPALL
ncbi:TIGR03620 family F420-dependent LLM class oxidoreductase [Actinomadura harenae]|uniref:TIGR03620 family F420-dependent LLM class oxidoreductase n=1 Tax=Actinomadura harenae TaxID=2483351 RepID=A0A3M2LP90_9ACTN|nr:TIGR03620 family F420-dependent LLM class oxidoreductase [Actinomadura harenae]RMI36648.1 TIGR03620 family F420-dependent LLM class oxidoreductase [Actinomadura harenae]